MSCYSRNTLVLVSLFALIGFATVSAGCGDDPDPTETPSGTDDPIQEEICEHLQDSGNTNPVTAAEHDHDTLPEVAVEHTRNDITLPEVHEEPIEEGCEHMADDNATNPIEASEFARTGSVPMLSAEHVRNDVTLPASGQSFAGYVELEADEDSEFILFIDSDVTIEITNASGNPVEIEETEMDVTECSEVAVFHVVDLEVGTYTVFLGPNDVANVSIVVEESGHEHEHEGDEMEEDVMFGGYAQFTSEGGEYSFGLSADIPLTVTDALGADVAIEATDSNPTGCTELSVLHTIDLEVGQYTLYFGPTEEESVSFVFENGDEAHD
ncbi:MAG: hypothetical protein KC561_15240, partial [Myxococcales bacterium]|nr:hypothetical protein [Myxococcales bacterium]